MMMMIMMMMIMIMMMILMTTTMMRKNKKKHCMCNVIVAACRDVELQLCDTVSLKVAAGRGYMASCWELMKEIRLSRSELQSEHPPCNISKLCD